MLSCKTEEPVEKVKEFFCNETGYQTPKLDTRAAIFKDEKILLVHEKNGTWSLPGGWCDVDQSVADNVIKETKEEAGLDVAVDKVIAVQDWRSHNACNLPCGINKDICFVQDFRRQLLRKYRNYGNWIFWKGRTAGAACE